MDWGQQPSAGCASESPAGSLQGFLHRDPRRNVVPEAEADARFTELRPRAPKRPSARTRAPGIQSPGFAFPAGGLLLRLPEAALAALVTGSAPRRRDGAGGGGKEVAPDGPGPRARRAVRLRSGGRATPSGPGRPPAGAGRGEGWGGRAACAAFQAGRGQSWGGGRLAGRVWEEAATRLPGHLPSCPLPGITRASPWRWPGCGRGSSRPVSAGSLTALPSCQNKSGIHFLHTT